MKLIILVMFFTMISSNVMSQDQIVLEQIKSKVTSNDEFPELKTSQEFNRTLSSIISVRWKNRQLRDAVHSLSNHYGISIILDRRIHPNQFLNLNSNDTTLIQLLKSVSQQSQASMTVFENGIYIGPSLNCISLRTIISQRETELEKVKSKKKFESKIKIQWNDLDSPVSIFKKLSNMYDLSVSNIELIPHDLWSNGSIPDTNFAQAASILLVQYDLTFKWDPTLNAITLIPASYPVLIKRSYTVSRKQIKNVVSGFQKNPNFPQITVRSHKVIFSGTIEEHEDFKNRLSGKKRKVLDKENEPVSLDRRRFTLELKSGSAKLLIDLLKKNGIKIEYHQNDLKSAGIDLNQKIEINLKKASIEELLDSFCIPLKIQFSIKGNTIHLTPLK